jgi:hypothetical protein
LVAAFEVAFFAADIVYDVVDDGWDVDDRAVFLEPGADEGGDGIALNGDGWRSKAGA